MALSDVKVRSAKPEAKPYKLLTLKAWCCWFTLTAQNTGGYVIALVVKRRYWRWENTPNSRWRMPGHVGIRPVSY